MAKTKKDNEEIIKDLKANNKKEKTDKPAKETKEEATKKVKDIVQKAKAKGKITYGELATELGDINPEQIDKVFDAFEEMGVDVLKDDFDEEPDVEEEIDEFEEDNEELEYPGDEEVEEEEGDLL